jgi:endonuclease III
MTASNRQTLIAKVFKVLKNHYKPVNPPCERSVLEHLLYACCLENSHFEAADEGFARLQQSYFDWNEVRVTTVTELAETLSCLADPSAAAARLKRCLQSIFETHYAFDLEGLKKGNLGKAVKDVETLSGTTPFVVAYVTQNGLSGHAIPCSQGIFDAFEVLEIITPAEAAKRHVPGLERAVAKTKGVEFASLLHQLGADYYAAPFGARTRTVLTEIDPAAKDRVPSRPAKSDSRSGRSATSASGHASSERAAKAAESAIARSAEPKKRKPSGDKPDGSHAKAAKNPAAKEEPDLESTAEPMDSAAEPSKSTSKQLTRKKPR